VALLSRTLSLLPFLPRKRGRFLPFSLRSLRGFSSPGRRPSSSLVDSQSLILLGGRGKETRWDPLELNRRRGRPRGEEGKSRRYPLLAGIVGISLFVGEEGGRERYVCHFGAPPRLGWCSPSAREKRRRKCSPSSNRPLHQGEAAFIQPFRNREGERGGRKRGEKKERGESSAFLYRRSGRSMKRPEAAKKEKKVFDPVLLFESEFPRPGFAREREGHPYCELTNYVRASWKSGIETPCILPEEKRGEGRLPPVSIAPTCGLERGRGEGKARGATSSLLCRQPPGNTSAVKLSASGPIRKEKRSSSALELLGLDLWKGNVRTGGVPPGARGEEVTGKGEKGKRERPLLSGIEPTGSSSSQNPPRMGRELSALARKEKREGKISPPPLSSLPVDERKAKASVDE